MTEETIVADKETYLSSRHFRNELFFYKNDYFEEFKRLAESTWHGLRIDNFDFSASEDEFIQLFLEDARFTAEIGLMGSGIQMWLQIIWFICRTKGNTTVVLDEPDVYMHPDLQRKILRVVKSRYPQVIIATHSVDIMSEVDSENIVEVDKNNRQMKYADNLKAVQSIIDNIGSAHNLSLIRISLNKKCLFVEGGDVKILSKFHEILFPESDFSLETLPCIPLGGFSKLNEAFGTAKLFHRETNGLIKTFCILDRDYYPEELINEKMETSLKNFLVLHIWSKKEIENYILIPSAIFRITQLPKQEYSNFLKSYEELVDSFKDQVREKIASKIQEFQKGWELCKCMKNARELMIEKWVGLEGKMALVGGKELLHKTNEWMNSKYNVSCSRDKIFKNINKNEISEEVKKVINSLLNNNDF